MAETAPLRWSDEEKNQLYDLARLNCTVRDCDNKVIIHWGNVASAMGEGRSKEALAAHLRKDVSAAGGRGAGQRRSHAPIVHSHSHVLTPLASQHKAP